MDERIQTLLFTYFSGRHTPAGEEELLHWLEADEKHQELFFRLAEWWATAHVPLFLSEKESNFAEHFYQLVRQRESTKQQVKRHLLRLTRVAAIVLPVISASLLTYVWTTHTHDITYAAVTCELTVPYGSQSEMRLPDNSYVWLNAGSSLVYSEDPEKGTRQVELEGEAYFEIAPDSLKPMCIRSQNIQIQVVGTSFNVRAYGDDDLIDVTLVSGKVDVFTGGEQREEMIELEPNRMLRFHKETSEYEVIYVNGRDATAWKNGCFRFRNQPFPQIARTLERKYNIPMIIESEKLHQEFFSGSFSVSKSLDDILREVDVDRKYTWTRTGDSLVIRDK